MQQFAVIELPELPLNLHKKIVCQWFQRLASAYYLNVTSQNKLYGISTICGWMPSLHIISHYSDIIMSLMASQITILTIVYSNVYSGVDQRKCQSSASLAFVRGIHRWPVNSPHKGLVMQKMFPFDDIIMKNQCMSRQHAGHTNCDEHCWDHLFGTKPLFVPILAFC